MNFYGFSNIYSMHNSINQGHVQVYPDSGQHKVHGGRHVKFSPVYFRIWTITDRVLRTENLVLRLAQRRDVHTVARSVVLIHSDTNEFFQRQNLENDIKEV